MKKAILFCTSLLVVVGVLIFSYKKPVSTETTVGVIVPMEHEALTQIVSGLKEGLGVRVKVLNAQGDPNLQKTMIEQLVREECAVLIPIGTAASQMTLHIAGERNVLCLAADSALLEEAASAHATSLTDELPAKHSIAFIKKAFPQLKKFTLVYSASEKIAKEIPFVDRAAKELGMDVQKLMIYSQADLYTMGNAIAPDSGAIFILKDHLVVSGVAVLAGQAEKRGIPLVATDEGSVLSGAAFAIGVKEADIGRNGAQIVQEILQGKDPRQIPPQTLQGPFPLFVNLSACQRQGVDVEALRHAAESQAMVVTSTEVKGP